MRYTEYHNGVAVIRDKSKLKDAMAKLAGYEDTEDSDNTMEDITTEFAEYICDKLCWAPKELEQEDLDEVCKMCRMDEFICNICNKYIEVDNFENSQASKLMKKYRNFVDCDECKYCQTDQPFGIECRFCSNEKGLDDHLEPGSGCSRGEKGERG